MPTKTEHTKTLDLINRDSMVTGPIVFRVGQAKKNMKSWNVNGQAAPIKRKGLSASQKLLDKIWTSPVIRPKITGPDLG